MQVRRLNIKQLEIGGNYLAYSAKNKMLSSPNGTLVKVAEVSGTGIKVQVLGIPDAPLTAIARLDSRQDAWVYDPAGCDVVMKMADFDETQWPFWTPRLEASGWKQREFILDVSRFYLNTREGAGNGVTLYRMEETQINEKTGRPYVTNFPLNWLTPVNPPEWRVPRAERMGLGAVELPLPPKPVKPEHEEAVKNLMPFLKKIDGVCTENVNHIRVDADFKHYDRRVNQACHRAIQEEPGFQAKYVCTMGWNSGSSSWVKGRPCDEALELYITYLTSYSPYAEAFLTKDVKFILEHGYVIDGDAPNRIVAGACFATRQVWERPGRAEAFLELYKAGVPLDAAFMFGSQCSVFKGGKMKFGLTSSDHNHFQNGRVSDKCMVNFLKHKPEFPGDAYTQDVYASSGPGGVDGMWSKAYGKTSLIHKKLLDIKRSNGTPMDNALSVAEAVEQAADFIDEWLDKHDLAR
jgi:hypothetical protein